ncbi:MAG: hypothetical protein QOC63_507 [Mycobacterium sp.]|nr:hypothetical protein [Mycobacterium sp.]
MPACGPAVITLSDVRTIAALKHARSGQYPPMTVAVLGTAGGVLVRDDDNACAIHGIAAAVLRADPGAADPTGSSHSY